MLATQFNHFIESHAIEKNSFIRLLNWATNDVQSRRLVILLECEPIENNTGGPMEKVGNPVNIEGDAAVVGAGGGGSGTGVAPQGQRQQQQQQQGMGRGQGQQQKPVQRGGFSGGAGAGGRGGAGAGGNQPAGPLYPIEGLSPYQNK